MTAKKSLLLLALLPLGLAACARDISIERLKDEGVYWQRADVSEATYMEGPKAQQMLHRDVALCVTELRELDRLGALRNALPGEDTSSGGIPDPTTPYGKLNKYDSPERDAYLLGEHADYDDFETCMLSHGWQRMEHVPYDVAKTARADYIEAVTGQKYRESVGEYNAQTGKSVTPDQPAASEYNELNH